MDYGTLRMIKREVDKAKAFGPGPSPFAVNQSDVELVSPSPRLPRTTQEVTEQEIMRPKKKSSGTRLHRPEPGMIVKVRLTSIYYLFIDCRFFWPLVIFVIRQQSMCEMKFKYVGRPGIGETAFLDPEDVVIEQQHCGGETIKVLTNFLF